LAILVILHKLCPLIEALLPVVSSRQDIEKLRNERVFYRRVNFLTIGIDCASSPQKSKSAPILALQLTFILKDTLAAVSMTDYFQGEGI
jgi:hypothetical protein